MKIDTSTKIGEVVRESRVALGISQHELARRMGVSQSILCRVEHSERRFDTDWIPLMPAPMRAAIQRALTNQVKNIARGRPDDDAPTPAKAEAAA